MTISEFHSVDDYINSFPKAIQEQLIKLRSIIISIVPKETKEIISWGMPTFYYQGNLVHFAAQKHHIGFYPGAACVELFREELGQLKHSKGAIQIPYGSDIPIDLIKKIVSYRIQETLTHK